MNFKYDCIAKYDYIKDELSNIIDCHASDLLVLASHPTKNEISVLTEKAILTYKLDNTQSPSNKILLPYDASTFYSCCQYSPDGNLILVNDARRMCIINLHTSNLILYIKSDDIKANARFMKADFYSNEVLTTLSIEDTKNQTDKKECWKIRYWDIHKQFVVYESPELDSAIRLKYNMMNAKGFNISFAPNKKDCLVTLWDKCLMMPVSSEARKEKEIFAYWILKNYQENNPEIPTDIVQYIATKL